ncbi:MAG: hypothetical protein AAF533_14445 [Acidobacteriota bacterium]
MSASVEYHCSACSRRYATPIDELLRRIQADQRWCQTCGCELVFPDEVRRHVASVDALNEVVTFACTGTCGRSFQAPVRSLRKRIGRGCHVCGGALSFPEHVVTLFRDEQSAERAKPSSVACPACDRTIPSSPCTWCGMTFVVPPGPPVEPVLADTAAQSPMASAADTKLAIGHLPAGHELTPWIARVLAGRTRRAELGRAELRDLVHAWHGLASWRPTAHASPFLPLPVATCIPVLSQSIFGCGSSFVDINANGRTELVMVLRQEEENWFAKLDKEAVAVSAVSLGLRASGLDFGELADVAELLDVDGGGEMTEDRTPDEHRIRARLVPDRGGTRFTLLSQVNDAPPTPWPAEQVQAFVAVLARLADRIERTVAVMTVLGPRSHGSPALGATEGALVRRLRLLGCQPESLLADAAARLVVRSAETRFDAAAS